MYSSIDAWHIKTTNPVGICGISSRIQEMVDQMAKNNPWNTFTIRKSRDTGNETEYSKLIRFIDSREWIHPSFHIQAYVNLNWDKLYSFAIAYTKDILKKIKDGEFTEKHYDNANFYAIKWGKYCLFRKNFME